MTWRAVPQPTWLHLLFRIVRPATALGSNAHEVPIFRFLPQLLRSQREKKNRQNLPVCRSVVESIPGAIVVTTILPVRDAGGPPITSAAPDAFDRAGGIRHREPATSDAQSNRIGFRRSFFSDVSRFDFSRRSFEPRVGFFFLRGVGATATSASSARSFSRQSAMFRG